MMYSWYERSRLQAVRSRQRHVFDIVMLTHFVGSPLRHRVVAHEASKQGMLPQTRLKISIISYPNPPLDGEIFKSV